MVLKVYLHGQLIHELQLNEEHEYIAGRSDTCDIILRGEKGISRQHVKFLFDGDHWQVELLSRFGALIVDGESHTHIQFNENQSILTPPFEFRLEEKASVQDEGLQQDNPSQPGKQVKDLSHLPVIADAASDLKNQGDGPSHHFGDEDDDEALGNLETTSIMHSEQQYILEVHYPNGDSETFKLEGNVWCAGRDPHNEVYLRSDNVSRKHFELEKKHDGFYITDLGSSNGTRLNGNTISPHNTYLINSGDKVEIKKVTIKFLIKNGHFEQLLNHVDESIFKAPAIIQNGNQQPPHAMQSFDFQNYNYNPNQKGAVRIPDDEFHWKDFSTYTLKHKIRATALSILPILIWVLLTNNPEKVEQISQTSVGTNITKEQKDLINDSLALAQRNYNAGKYTSCLLETGKIHAIIATGYENSKQLEVYCQTGKEQTEIVRENDRRAEERRKVDARVREIAAICQKIIDTFKTIEDANNCLSEAITLNPEAEEVQSIISFIEQKVLEEKQALEKKRNYQAQIQKGEQAYQSALSIYKSKNYRTGIDALESYLKSSYPDPKNNKSEARKLIAVAEQKMNEIIGESLEQCKKLIESKSYKEAMQACLTAQKQDPKNKTVSLLKADIRKKLSVKMREFYENASIEENYGNIEAAKEMWKKIADEDFNGGSEYFHKARLKLKQYGL